MLRIAPTKTGMINIKKRELTENKKKYGEAENRIE